MTELNNEVFEMTSEELDQVSGGDIISQIDGKYLDALGARLLGAVHIPMGLPVPPMTLHMR